MVVHLRPKSDFKSNQRYICSVSLLHNLSRRELSAFELRLLEQRFPDVRITDEAYLGNVPETKNNNRIHVHCSVFSVECWMSLSRPAADKRAFWSADMSLLFSRNKMFIRIALPLRCWLCLTWLGGIARVGVACYAGCYAKIAAYWNWTRNWGRWKERTEVEWQTVRQTSSRDKRTNFQIWD